MASLQRLPAHAALVTLQRGTHFINKAEEASSLLLAAVGEGDCCERRWCAPAARLPLGCAGALVQPFVSFQEALLRRACCCGAPAFLLLLVVSLPAACGLPALACTFVMLERLNTSIKAIQVERNLHPRQ